jgi:hypothetical protein
MKRISLLTTIVILASVPCLTKARSYFPVRYRTRWSPYASGLVTGDVYYSPYAFRVGHNGLVPGNVRYSPYAFGIKRSGLVADPWWPYGFRFNYALDYQACRPSAAVGCSAPRPCQTSMRESLDLLDKMKSYNEEKLAARIERIEKRRESNKQINMGKGKDGKEIIYGYLKSRNIDDFEMKRLFKVNNKTVSVSFLLRDKNIMITYRDLGQVQSLLQQSGYKSNYYVRHEQAWRKFAQKYKQAGGKVYQITSADKEEILAKLMLCPELSDG